MYTHIGKEEPSTRTTLRARAFLSTYAGCLAAAAVSLSAAASRLSFPLPWPPCRASARQQHLVVTPPPMPLPSPGYRGSPPRSGEGPQLLFGRCLGHPPWWALTGAAGRQGRGTFFGR